MIRCEDFYIVLNLVLKEAVTASKETASQEWRAVGGGALNH